MAAQGRAAVGHQADARPHHTSRSAHLRQRGADDNQIDQDERFNCHVNKAAPAPGPDVKRRIAHPIAAARTALGRRGDLPCAARERWAAMGVAAPGIRRR
ncbi:hypothetical protein [Halomonas cupida]|uniref:hypothetical protein n=1 Tax=Halomonas cupida TaxID=44933 RepID=UPI003A910E0B